MRPEVASAQGFTGIGEAVHHVGEEQKQLHEHGVDGKHGGSLARSSRGEVEIDGHKKQCAQEYVAVDTEETAHGAPCKQSVGTEIPAQSTVASRKENRGNRQSGILRNHRSQGNSFHFHPQQAHKGETHNDVCHVLHYGGKHGYARVLHTDEPSRQSVERQHGRCTPDADAEICGHRRSHIRRGTDQEEHHAEQRPLQHHQRKGQRQCYSNRPDKQTGGFGEVAPTESLRHSAARAHAQKAEYPVNEVEYHCANGYRAHIYHTAQMPCYGHVDHAEQRNGDV